MSQPSDAIPPSPASPRWLVVVLIVLAALKTWSALADLPGAFHDFGHTQTALVAAQAITTAKLIVMPVIVLTALYLAARQRLTGAIVALAIAMLAEWLSELPGVAIHGLEFSLHLGGLEIAANRILYPILAVAAIVLALRRRLLPLASAFVALPTIVTGSLVAAFAVSVAIYGF